MCVHPSTGCAEVFRSHGRNVESRRRALVVIGTRPEAIKQAPVIWALRSKSEFETTVISTGQHREMLASMWEMLEIAPDVELDLMRPNQSLSGLTARCLEAIDERLVAEQPDVVFVQGDTTTAMAAALAAFFRRIPVAHVEAGLRSGSLDEPFPEEANRIIADGVARWCFAPTEKAADLLRAAAVSEDRIFVTGNTVVDCLHRVRPRLDRIDLEGRVGVGGRPMVLITCHRRESFGAGVESVCAAVRELAHAFADHDFVYPVHLNPNVREPVARALGGLPNVRLIEPAPYDTFLALQARARLILTDSGGVQEEAPSFGVPMLVLRNRTERPEGVAAGCAKLVGTDTPVIVEEAARLLRDDLARAAMARAQNPYGDGHAAERIATIVAEALAATESGIRRRRTSVVPSGPAYERLAAASP